MNIHKQKRNRKNRTKHDQASISNACLKKAKRIKTNRKRKKNKTVAQLPTRQLAIQDG